MTFTGAFSVVSSSGRDATLIFLPVSVQGLTGSYVVTRIVTALLKDAIIELSLARACGHFFVCMPAAERCSFRPAGRYNLQHQ